MHQFYLLHLHLIRNVCYYSNLVGHLCIAILSVTDGNNKTYSRACGMSFGSDGCFTYTTATQVVHLHCNCEGDLCNG